MVCETLKVSERRACLVLEQPRSVQQYKPLKLEWEKRLIERLTYWAYRMGRIGYKKVTSLLRAEGWRVNKKRVLRLWRQEGLKVPKRQPKRRRLWLGDGSCIRLRAERPNHIWSYDFVKDTTSDGKPLRFLTVIDEYTRECLALPVGRTFKAEDVQISLKKLFVERGMPEFIRSDNGPEFIAAMVKDWLHKLKVRTLYIEPGSPWENGYNESFNGKFRDEFLTGELFDTVWEARVLAEEWRWAYNTLRPHGSLNYLPPKPGAVELGPKSSQGFNPWRSIGVPV
jgi:transposase InsO family protein